MINFATQNSGNKYDQLRYTKSWECIRSALLHESSPGSEYNQLRYAINFATQNLAVTMIKFATQNLAVTMINFATQNLGVNAISFATQILACWL